MILKTKGIVLAGGKGTRLYPITKTVSKQLLPVYDKPMIYYSISVLMLAGIQDIAIITTPHDQANFKQLLGDGSHLGVSFTYIAQDTPAGLPHAFIVAEDFIQHSPCVLVLGDNIFYGQGFSQSLQTMQLSGQTHGHVFLYPVHNPQDFGVAVLDGQQQITQLVEKPTQFISNYAVSGLYAFPPGVVKLAATLRPSARHELEIVDLLRLYLDKQQLEYSILGRGFAWLDTGSVSGLLEASQFVATIENRQGFKIACLEEIAWRKGWISTNQMVALATEYNNGYGEYLRQVSSMDYWDR
jgi:glucose-1-phosphate thymidylyltransferase